MKRIRSVKITAWLLAISLVLALLPADIVQVSAAEVAAGTPYTSDGTYDVTVSHVVVNQVYGGSTDGYADYSFIELYNPTDAAVCLNGWTIAYKSSSAGDNNSAWETLSLTGTIPAEGYYLIRCAAVTTTTNVCYNVPEGDQEWDMALYNKGLSVALFSTAVTDDDLTDFSGNVINDTSALPEGYVDMVAVQGNDSTDDEAPDAYETAYSDLQSKKKAVRRTDAADTDDNSADLTEVNYSGTVSDDEGPHNSSSSAAEDGGETGSTDGEETEGYTVTFTVDEGITIDIYYTQDYTTASETNVTSAVARDSSSGEVDTSGEGQVNFKVNVADGYTLGTVSADENYKNLKEPSDTGEDGVYRLTKVTGAVTVTVTATKDSTDDGDGTADSPSTYTTTSFETDADLNLSLLNSINIGTANTDGGVAEIVAYNSDNATAYTVNGQDGKLYYFSVTSSGLTQTGSLDVETMIEAADADFSYGDLTSVAVDTVNDHIALAIQAEDYADSGRAALLDYDLNLIAVFETGVQPDMVCFTPDGSVILTADEGEPREGYGDETTDPAGTITIIDLANEKISTAGFEDYSASDLTEESILLGIVDGETLSPKYDLEPEYITVSSDGSTAYVTLQEANAIAVVDIASASVTSVQSLGFKDYSNEENAVDLQDDDTYSASTYEDVLGVYMPDTISSYEVDGTTYLVTANEGDAREWGDYTNETKVTLTAADGNSNKVRALDSTYTALPDSSKTYLFGGRSFAIYQVGSDGTLTQVYESANDFEEYTAQYLSTWFNCSNDDIEIDSRSQKKGPEPEGVAIGTIDGKTYAFIGLERIGGIMVYDITDPSNSTYVNYINTRDFSEDIAGDVSPEGLSVAVLSDGTPILLAAYEVSGNLAAYSFSDGDGNAVTGTAKTSSGSAYTVSAHTYEVTAQQDATCTEGGYVTYTCSFCGDTYTETTAATGHSYTSKVTTAATCTAAGVRTYTCSTCGDTYTETIAATGHSYSGNICSSCGALKTSTVSSASVTLSQTSYTYDGSAKTPGVTVKVNDTTLVKDTDYTVTYANNKSAGTATVTITGKGSYSGSIAKTFTIAKQTLSASKVSLSYTSKTYTGSALKPTVTVKNAAGTKLTKNTDYTVSYADNKKAGTATVTIKGKGNYSGTVTKTFTIKKASQSLTVKSTTKTVKYSSLKKKKQTVTAITKVSGAKGTVTYKRTSGSSKISVNSKTGKITVKKGTAKGTYKIKVKVSSAATANYKSASKTVTITVKVK